MKTRILFLLLTAATLAATPQQVQAPQEYSIIIPRSVLMRDIYSARYMEFVGWYYGEVETEAYSRGLADHAQRYVDIIDEAVRNQPGQK